jgi:hypothetical protein
MKPTVSIIKEISSLIFFDEFPYRVLKARIEVFGTEFFRFEQAKFRCWSPGVVMNLMFPMHMICFRQIFDIAW